MYADQYVRHLLLEDPSLSDSAITIKLNKHHGVGSSSYSYNYSITAVKFIARRVRHNLSKWKSLP